jgi:hypothetical protein
VKATPVAVVWPQLPNNNARTLNAVPHYAGL